MKWTKDEEKEARAEYEILMRTLFNRTDFKNEWKGHWEDESDEAFGRITVLKGDRDKYMNYWLEDREILNDKDWDKITTEEDKDYGDF